ncbi:MAG: carboxylesterase family protein, partial [Eubacteriales bacterium]
MNELIIQTKNGKLQGHVDGETCAWLGIPYAKPPVGRLRFAPPQPVEKWEGVRSAAAFGNASPQDTIGIGPKSEDCLFLNIWSPAADTVRRPVMFYVHGGAFVSGSGNENLYYGTSLALKGDVVVVTINYRVGALGFMDFSFLGPEFCANCGLHDVVLALKWVHENIAAFGGDPDNITVFGQSAGGTITATLATMPSAKQYISKCIVMSGGPTHLQPKIEAHAVAKKYMEFMGIQTPEDLFELPVQKIVSRLKEFAHFCKMGSGTFRLTVDGEFVPEFPIPAVMQGAASGIPFLIGTTKQELSFLFVRPVAKALDIMEFIKHSLIHENEEFKQMLLQTYEDFFKGRKAKVMLFTDLIFRVGNVWFAKECSRHADVWMYRFDFETAAMKVSRLYTFHSSDLPFVFGNFNTFLASLMLLFSPSRKKAHNISEQMQNDFLEFVRSGRLQWKPCNE